MIKWREQKDKDAAWSFLPLIPLRLTLCQYNDAVTWFIGKFSFDRFLIFLALVSFFWVYYSTLLFGSRYRTLALLYQFW